MLAGELFENADGFEDVQISGIFCNSQKIKPGGVFVCLKGEHDDGHRYVENACKRGAAVLVASERVEADVPIVYAEDTAKALAELAQKFYGYPSRELKLIGVTGTNGKTTVTFLIKSILEADGKKVGVIGTNKCFALGRELDFESTLPTTPNALELAELFDIFRKQGIEYVVMEVSSHALSLKRVHGLEFEVGVFTNLTQDHLDFHKTMQNYAKAKAKLFEQSKKAVINIDSSAANMMLKSCNVPTITVGIGEASIRATLVRLGTSSVAFTAREGKNEYTITMPIPGKFSVYNALCALGAARALGVDFRVIGAGLATTDKVKGRVELVPTDTDYKVFIDYAHSPDSLISILQTAKGFTKGRVIVLFGCGGDRDKTKREPMGTAAGELADFTIITSDNPRGENPVEIIEAVKRGIDKTTGEYIIIVNRREAIEYALSIAQRDDTVLLCGKGQETYQLIEGRKIHFDEREIVKEILENNGG